MKRPASALRRFGQGRGREWLGWHRSVVQALDACRAPLRALDEAFLHTWQELAERLVTRSSVGADHQYRTADCRADSNAPRCGRRVDGSRSRMSSHD